MDITISFDNLVELLLEVHEAVSVDIACMHPDGQVVTLEQPQSVLFVLQLVDALGHLANLQLLQTGLVLQTLLQCQVNFIVHFGMG